MAERATRTSWPDEALPAGDQDAGDGLRQLATVLACALVAAVMALGYVALHRPSHEAIAEIRLAPGVEMPRGALAPERLREVVAALSLDADREFSGEGDPLSTLLRLVLQREAGPSAERARARLAERVEARVLADGAGLAIAARSADPAKATRIADAIGEGILKRLSVIQPSPPPRDTPEQQRLRDLARALGEAQGRLAAAENGPAAPPPQPAATTPEATGSASPPPPEVAKLAVARARLAQARARLARLERARRGGDAEVMAGQLRSPAMTRLRADLDEIRDERAAAARKLGRKHPILRRLRAEEARIEAALGAETGRLLAAARTEAARARTVERELAARANAAKAEVAQPQALPPPAAAGTFARIESLRAELAARRRAYEVALAAITERAAPPVAAPTGTLISAALGRPRPLGPSPPLVLGAATTLGLIAGAGVAAAAFGRRRRQSSD